MKMIKFTLVALFVAPVLSFAQSMPSLPIADYKTEAAVGTSASTGLYALKKMSSEVVFERATARELSESQIKLIYDAISKPNTSKISFVIKDSRLDKIFKESVEKMTISAEGMTFEQFQKLVKETPYLTSITRTTKGLSFELLKRSAVATGSALVSLGAATYAISNLNSGKAERGDNRFNNGDRSQIKDQPSDKANNKRSLANTASQH